MDILLQEITGNCFTKIEYFGKLNIWNLYIGFWIQFLKKINNLVGRNDYVKMFKMDITFKKITKNYFMKIWQFEIKYTKLVYWI